MGLGIAARLWRTPENFLPPAPRINFALKYVRGRL